MPYSSGTFSVVYNWTTEAGSAPIEIAKLTEQDADFATGMSLAMLRDGTGLPTANQNFNGFTLTNIATATTLTGVTRVSELIDQDHIYYVDSGSANTIAITPSPAIAAYEEGQRFVIRVAASNSGATTLNVNSLGAFAVQTPDGVALTSGALLIGGIYEFTYDANTTPDRWVLTSPPSNVAYLGAANTFTANTQTIQGSSPNLSWNNTGASSGLQYWRVGAETDGDWFVSTRTDSGSSFGEYAIRITRNSSSQITSVLVDGDTIQLNGVLDVNGNPDFSGTLTTPNTSAAEVGFKGIPDATDETPVLTDAGKIIQATGNVTIPANGSVAYPIGTVITVINRSGGSITIAVTTDSLTLAGTSTSGTRTLATAGLATLLKYDTTAWIASGAGLS